MVAAVALFAAASCNKELPQEENLPTVGETVVYTASTDAADTKAVLNETTKKSEWVAGDAITVHDGTKGWTFTAAEAGANVDFSNSEGFGDYRPVLAVYPAGTYEVDFAAKTVNANIPTYQPARKGTYNEEAALAVAYSENDQFAFKNAHALIKFTIKSSNIKAIEFYGNNEEAITGNMLVSLNENNTIKSVEGQDTVFEEGKPEEWTGKGTWVKIYSEDEANGWCFENGATYYAAVAPVNFTKGVAINYILSDDTKVEAVKKTDNPVNLTPSKILNIGDLKYEAPATVEKVYLQPGVWSADNAWFSAHFFNSVGGAEDVKMTDDDEDGVYEVSVPDGMESVIFCRMNPDFTEFGWDVWEGETETENHVWNQTGNLAIPLADDTKVYYNVTDWEAGEWSDTPQESTPEEPGAESSGWSLPGGHNNWNTEDTFLYEEGDYYVAKNVSGLNAGFKFTHAEFGWKGVGSEAAVAVGEWHKLNGDKNISLPDAKAYDIYMTKDGSQFQAVVAGSVAPEAPVVVADYWGIVGSMAESNWATDLKFTEEAEYWVYKGLALTASTQFQIRKNSEWADAKIASANPAKANTEYDLVPSNSNNMKVSTAGTYDVYMTKDITKVYFMDSGKTPDQAGQSAIYRFYIKNTLGWSDLCLYAWGGYSTGGWPGTKLTSMDTVEGYGECYYVEIPVGTNIVNFIVNGSGGQTKDLTKSKAKQLANGDYIYELVQADKK